MSESYVGEIRMIAGTYAPVNWAFCEGQHLFIAQHEALFDLIGTTFGGDGQTFFALPDLRGRIPIHNGRGSGLTFRQIGDFGGTENVTLTAAQLPVHTHPAQSFDGPGSAPSPGAGIWAGSISEALFRFGPPDAGVSMKDDSISIVGGGKSHQNMAPFQCVNFIISLFGLVPTPG